MRVERINSAKILITGSNGQLGRCLADVAEHYPDYDFHFKTSKELDITTKEQIRSLFAQEKFDYCINCAAYTAVDKAETDKENAFLVNAEAVKYLAEACKENETILIHISTDFVFDGKQANLYVEDDLGSPLGVYGVTKLDGENAVLETLEDYFVIRTSWLYSEYGHNFLKTMLRLGNEKKQLNVVCDQIGTPTYAKDLAETIVKIITTNCKSYGIYHYSNEGVASWYDFAVVIFELSNLDVTVLPINSIYYKTPAERPKFSVMDKSKIKKVLNFQIPHWRESLQKCLNSL